MSGTKVRSALQPLRVLMLELSAKLSTSMRSVCDLCNLAHFAGNPLGPANDAYCSCKHDPFVLGRSIILGRVFSVSEAPPDIWHCCR
jgi:hypothetical protein